MYINKLFSLEFKKTLENLNSIFERFRIEYSKEMEMVFKDHDKLFAAHGWCIFDGSTIEDVLFLLKLYNEERFVEADKNFMKLYEDNINDIESDLSSINKDTSHIIKEAIQCHKKGFYFASTILLISLTDGIAEGKLFTNGFFQKIKRKNKKHFLLDVFNEKNLVNKHFIPKKSSSSELMRHGIMHGNSINYGSQINSLKALSLYYFISIRKYLIK
ncbi:hypothetical protein LPB03_01965 [Polaribacter vadi]|uniref:DUF4209 domain-containing protein n=1 Tax=Polaribacter vadi TaxID=1774273 RepID=A0A1B8U0I2_9FLAO|nr:hypothetical protein [Polaribacter vadi]AOW16302.1 hypothetical protein LPB03_01965 [Polaribacter vadi]OBY65371.1 hypothetical protein LPB3_03145 [Polaribacter vadi]